jgi:hypothetical protein
LTYRFWLPPFGIFWPLCCLFFFDLQILITSLWYLQTLLLWVIQAIFVCCRIWSVFKVKRGICDLLGSNAWWLDTDGIDNGTRLKIKRWHLCVVCSSLTYRFWLPPFGIFWPLCCLFFFDLQILITSLWYLQTLLLWVIQAIVSHVLFVLNQAAKHIIISILLNFFA